MKSVREWIITVTYQLNCHLKASKKVKNWRLFTLFKIYNLHCRIRNTVIWHKHIHNQIFLSALMERDLIFKVADADQGEEWGERSLLLKQTWDFFYRQAKCTDRGNATRRGNAKESHCQLKIFRKRPCGKYFFMYFSFFSILKNLRGLNTTGPRARGFPDLS